MPRPGATLDGSQRAYFDRLAALAFDPDADLDELRQLYEVDAGLRVPTMVFNAQLQRPEALRRAGHGRLHEQRDQHLRRTHGHGCVSR